MVFNIDRLGRGELFSGFCEGVCGKVGGKLRECDIIEVKRRKKE